MSKKFKSPFFYYLLKGDYALFTDPITKGGGEKFSYQIPTYQAVKAITEQIYWKPTLVICIDELKVINPIRTQTKGIRTLFGKGKENAVDRSNYTYLKDVEYAIKYHFEWNEQRKDLIKDRNELKHIEILKRSLIKGGRKDIFLGVRECIGYAKPLNAQEYNQIESFYNDMSMSFGLMFHSFNYPTELIMQDYQRLQSNFSNIQMENGKIVFCRPDQCEVTFNLGKFDFEKIVVKNIKSIDEEYMDVMNEEVIE